MFTCSDMYTYSTDEVGMPLAPSAVIKLVSWEEGGYTVQGKSEYRNGSNITDIGPCCGEIHLSDDRMAKGYFRSHKTDNSFYTDDDGTSWFR